jgi:hypothetical protein
MQNNYSVVPTEKFLLNLKSYMVFKYHIEDAEKSLIGIPLVEAKEILQDIIEKLSS